VDNGIGMADRHIRRLFAYAGQRFADSHEFHIDRARWDEAEIKFFPNSRFGVGVLSYFMLAEELDIASRRWAPPSDLAPPSVRARIIGSGSLFRLDTAIDLRRLTDDYGTSVRLHLREDAPANDDLIKSILNWLFVPEVAVTISPEVGEIIELMPGKPTDRFRSLASNVLLPVQGSETTTGSTRVYIAPSLDLREIAQASNSPGNERSNFALVDGIFTRLAGEPWPDCLVVNLTEDLRAKLTVDRRQVDLEETTVDPVLDWIRENGGRAIAAWRAPDLFTLHTVLRKLDPNVTVSADAILRASASPDFMMVSPSWGSGWPLSVGISDLDPEILLEVSLASKDADLLATPIARRLHRADRRDSLSVRPGVEVPLDAAVNQAMFHRTKELADAGLALPTWLQQAVSFEMRNGAMALAAAYGPLIAAYIAQARQIDSVTRFPRWDRPRPLGSARKEGILRSRDLDDAEPYLQEITVPHLFRASCLPEFGALSEAVKVARSIEHTGIDLSDCVHLHDDLVAQFDKVPITEIAQPIIQRLFHARDYNWPASVWDLALGATLAEIEPEGMYPVLDLLEACRADVARCREFLAFCAEKP
jgi:hypothetical protein